VNADGSRLYVANAITDAVAVIDTAKLTSRTARKGMAEPIGFVPTEWMPMSMAFIASASGGKLYVATAKGKGTGPNNMPQAETEGTRQGITTRIRLTSEPAARFAGHTGCRGGGEGTAALD